MDDDLRIIMGNVSSNMTQFHEALEQRAGELESKGDDPELVAKLKKGADAMKDSGNIYMSWARHFVALSEREASEADEGEEDSADFQF